MSDAVEFAGAEARIVLKFLDGQMIDVSANDHTREQAAGAARGLAAKLDPATEHVDKSRYVKAVDRRVSAIAHF